MLQQFHAHPEFGVLRADTVSQIGEYIQYVSDSLVKQSSRPNPDVFPGYDKTNLESLGG